MRRQVYRMDRFTRAVRMTTSMPLAWLPPQSHLLIRIVPEAGPARISVAQPPLERKMFQVLTGAFRLEALALVERVISSA